MSTSISLTMDTISLRNLRMSAIIGPDAWCRPSKPQPLILSLYLSLDTQNAAVSDDIHNTFSYGVMCKDVLVCTENAVCSSIDELFMEVARPAEKWPGECLRIQALAPKALLRCEGGLETAGMLRKKSGNVPHGGAWVIEWRSWSIRGLKVACIIGVNPHERGVKQTVVIDLKVVVENNRDENAVKQTVQPEVDPGHNDDKVPSDFWQRMVKYVCDIVEPSSFQTLEALALAIATTCLQKAPQIPNITVSVEKPSALAAVDGAGVEITRDRKWLEQQR